MSLDPELAKQVYERDNWRCKNCRSSSGLHIHHIVFKSQQGPDELWNLVTLCSFCHLEGVHRGKLDVWVDTNGDVHFRWAKNWKPS